MLTIETRTESRGHITRMSTQDLLQTISEAVKQGETEFTIHASGQHDIGGPLWNTADKDLVFHVTNPGQRVGAMVLPKTTVIVEGPAPADAGWLNSGGTVIIRGDAGDTAGHCAASGKLYIGGRAGTRSGSLMKKDPLFPAPELWVLQRVGSFSFEFMSGGIAVVCGLDTPSDEYILGDRPCVGMVGGTIYVRATGSMLPEECVSLPLENADIDFLREGLPRFLHAVSADNRAEELSHWESWQKIVPTASIGTIARTLPRTLREYRETSWIANGIFSDVLPDSGEHHGLLGRGRLRLRVPHWSNRAYQAPCEFSCPIGIPSQLRFNLLREGKTEEALRLVLAYTPFPGSVCGSLCPGLCMLACTRYAFDAPIQLDALGLLSATVTPDKPQTVSGRRVAVIGGGIAGLTAAWQLKRLGHTVTLFEKERVLGGKIEERIPEKGLPHTTFHAEIARIQAFGVTCLTEQKIDEEQFQMLRKDYDAIVLATGARKKPSLRWKGIERAVFGTDYLKSLASDAQKKSAETIVIIGCGHTATDCAKAALAHGTKKITFLDVQRPKALPGELEPLLQRGAKLVWPCVTKEITEKGVVTEDGRFFAGQECLLCIPELPDVQYLPKDLRGEGERLVPKSDGSICHGVFVCGDMVESGLVSETIASGNEAALSVDAFLHGKLHIRENRPKIPAEQLHLAWFVRHQPCALPAAEKDYERCVSCGTCRDCHLCESSCPERAIHRVSNDDGSFSYVSDDALCIGCGICCGVCASGVWSLSDNTELTPFEPERGEE